MLDLSDVTVFCVDGTDYGNHNDKLLQIIESMRQKIKLGGVKYFSLIDPKCGSLADFVQIDAVKNLAEYSGVVIDTVPNYIETKFAMSIHDDGFPINIHNWKPQFLNYDYIGAPWGAEANTYPHQYFNNQVEGGNGGFSIRSMKLMRLAQSVMDKITQPMRIRDRIKAGSFHEDGYICYEIRHFLRANDCTFAPYHLGKLFSLETHLEDGPNDIETVFGFHGKRHINFETALEKLRKGHHNE